MGEFELIHHYFASAACARRSDGVALGIGDDGALLEPDDGQQLAVSTDTLVAGIHFPPGSDPFQLGQRALAVTASDLAAMGAEPLGFTLALTLPEADPDWLQGFVRGLDEMAAHCRLCLVGGDTTRGPLSMTLTVFGQVPRGQALLRSGAQPGDWLCVSGELGDAAAALPLVLSQRDVIDAAEQKLLARYWRPEPQLQLGQALRGKATAALDISDGLLADCGHIARASGVGLLIEMEKLPLSSALLQTLDRQQARRCALSGGDDYQLAFTVPPAQLAELQRHWPEIRVIGRAVNGDFVQLIDTDGSVIDTRGIAGYQHFQEDTSKNDTGKA